MRTRLILATAVSLTLIGAGSYAVNHPGLFTAFAQDANVEAGDAAPAEAEATDTTGSETATETETTAETVETTDAEAPADSESAESAEHADHTETGTQPDSDTGTTPEN